EQGNGGDANTEGWDQDRRDHEKRQQQEYVVPLQRCETEGAGRASPGVCDRLDLVTGKDVPAGADPLDLFGIVGMGHRFRRRGTRVRQLVSYRPAPRCQMCTTAIFTTPAITRNIPVASHIAERSATALAASSRTPRIVMP